MNKSECVKHIKKEGPGKVYFKNLICLVAVLALLAAFSYTCPDGIAYAQDSAAAGKNISMSNADYLNMLTNQYVIDYSRAQTLKSKLKNAPVDKVEEARSKADEAAARRQRSLDGLLNAIDGLIASQGREDVNSYISTINENYQRRPTRPRNWPCGI